MLDQNLETSGLQHKYLLPITLAPDTLRCVSDHVPHPDQEIPISTAAVENLESLPEDQYRESSQILQLLRDNLQNWAAKDAA